MPFTLVPTRLIARELARVVLLVALASCTVPSAKNNYGLGDLLPKTDASAVARLEHKNGSAITGTISFAQRGDKVEIAALVQNLDPGRHSMYIHENGNCSSSNAASAGRVWALVGAAPGRPRVGNLPELVANSNGDASIVATLRGITIGDGTPLDIVGHAVVVHNGLDPDPRPEFGVRNGWLACGVIERQ
jgi:superoxide dismutase, Cu-Zn family